MPRHASRTLNMVLWPALAAVACARTAHMPAGAGEHHVHTAEPATITIPAGAGYTAADVRFMQGMIHHHGQAVVMAGLAGRNGASAAIARLSRKIDISQQDEIAMMQAWLKARNQAAPPADDAHGAPMPGMLSAEQLKALGDARGVAFDRLFLQLMIQHHEGAIRMVADLFASPGAGQEPELFRFASDVDADQRGEIGRMQDMLTSLPTRGNR